jgi:hypothetical protein
VSLDEANPPLHSWLLALGLSIAEDPVQAGRLVSVAIATLTVPALFWFARSTALGFGGGQRGNAQQANIAAFLACALMITSPLCSLMQRLARPDGLFLLEAILVGAASIRLGDAAKSHSRRAGRRVGSWAIASGALMGLTMLSRQGVSYALWGVFPAAFLLQEGRSDRHQVMRFAWALALAGIVAAVIWTPMLLARSDTALSVRVFHRPLVRQSLPPFERVSMVARHVRDLIGWLWAYLTPPVAVVSLATMIAVLVSRRWRLAVFLLCWSSLPLLPVIVVATVFFPRYVIAAAIFLFLMIGLQLAAETPPRTAKLVPWCVCLLLVLPLRDVLLQLKDWRHQVLAPVDRWQLVSGWPAGYATERAGRYLSDLSRQRRTVVVTAPGSGNPADTLWLYRNAWGLSLCSDGNAGQPTYAGRADQFVCDGDPRARGTSLRAPIAQEATVFYVARETFDTPTGLQRTQDVLRSRYPAITLQTRMCNPPEIGGRPGDCVAILSLR